MKQDDWNDWNESEHLQLDQYDKQFMFGDPVIAEDDSAIFHLVWTYVVKELDGRKKARCVCDGSTRSGQVRVLDHTYANCVDRTGSRIFYAISAAENMLIYGADVSNAFAEHHLRNRGSSSTRTGLFTIGGSLKRGNPLYLMATLSLSLALCRDTQNPHASGKNISIESYVTSGSHQLYTSRASTPASSSANASSSCDRLTILRYRPRHNASLITSLI
jgi:hypothetical protein